jgi:hypothetical protein
VSDLAAVPHDTVAAGDHDLVGGLHLVPVAIPWQPAETWRALDREGSDQVVDGQPGGCVGGVVAGGGGSGQRGQEQENGCEQGETGTGAHRWASCDRQSRVETFYVTTVTGRAVPEQEAARRKALKQGLSCDHDDRNAALFLARL